MQWWATFFRILFFSSSLFQCTHKTKVSLGTKFGHTFLQAIVCLCFYKNLCFLVTGQRKLRLKTIVLKITTRCTRVVILLVIFNLTLLEHNYQSRLINRQKFRYSVLQAISNQRVFKIQFFSNKVSENFHVANKKFWK